MYHQKAFFFFVSPSVSPSAALRYLLTCLALALPLFRCYVPAFHHFCARACALPNCGASRAGGGHLCAALLPLFVPSSGAESLEGGRASTPLRLLRFALSDPSRWAFMFTCDCKLNNDDFSQGWKTLFGDGVRARGCVAAASKQQGRRAAAARACNRAPHCVCRFLFPFAGSTYRYTVHISTTM